MDNNLFYTNISKIGKDKLLDRLNELSLIYNNSIYVIDKPLGVNETKNNIDKFFVIILPKHKLLFIDFTNEKNEEFSDYVDDFIEDLGYISKKFDYQNIIGRPRIWKDKYVEVLKYSNMEPMLENVNILNSYLEQFKIIDIHELRTLNFIKSLAIGSINDIERIGGNFPDTILDEVKKKIVLFDGDQTRFIYSDFDNKIIHIQGLAGTGKTELLLHKLKDLYVSDKKAKIVFTCYSTILAESMMKRVPNFFDFMKVEEQIKWNERLWVMRSWGSRNDYNTGLYRYICHFYEIEFLPYSYTNKFEDVCQKALEYIKRLKEEGRFEYCFDYVLIDESQDFPKSFFDLCDCITKHKIYAAGDIFQDIYDRQINNKDNVNGYNLILNKCYRTDPKTLMFAHALGMGLYEHPVLRWLDDDEWKVCGYELKRADSKIIFTRKPLNRFNGVYNNIKTIQLQKCDNKFDSVSKEVCLIINKLRHENETIKPDDIAIVFADNTSYNYMYSVMDRLALDIKEKFDWNVNKGYEEKEQKEDTIMLTNRNYIKGLEYPFIICIALRPIADNIYIRNSLYMILTRSFITSYFIMNEKDELFNIYNEAANNINNKGEMCINEPSSEEKVQVNEKLNLDLQKVIKVSEIEDIILQIADEQRVKDLDLLTTIKFAINGVLKSEPDLKYDKTALKTRIEKIIAAFIGKA